jgi:hypothetical protein
MLTLEDVRGVQWSQSWRWEVLLEGLSAPFGNWFPATKVRENMWALQEHGFPAGQGSYSFPRTSSEFDVEVTYIDDVKLTVEHWITKWVNEEILNNSATEIDKGITPLKDCLKRLEIKKYDNKMGLVSHAIYMVYPKGALYFSGNSDADRHIESITFVVCQTLSGGH